MRYELTDCEWFAITAFAGEHLEQYLKLFSRRLDGKAFSTSA
jgi:hypothetical protein